jgi:hypothetical protein
VNTISGHYGYQCLSLNSVSVWNDLLSHAVNASYRASIPYEYSKGIFGRKSETFLIKKDGKAFAGAHYSVRSGRMNIIRTGDINSGIILKRGDGCWIK